ncbi:hypothetical protein M918_20885 [Clostridium sp. BL8]|nr:hypothetical protein M918_20885 [Clostridium sp. BL8]
MNSTLKYFLIFILIVALLIQGTWVFKDARKKNIRYYWFWGLICLLNIPTNLIIYLIVRHYKQKSKGVEK